MSAPKQSSSGESAYRWAVRTARLNFSNATEEKIITGITRLAETLKANA